MFAINRTAFQIYNLSGRDTAKWFNRFLKRIGEEPVIFDSLLVNKSKSELTKLFINKGYVNVNVSSDIDRNNKRAKVKYIIRGNKPYRIGQLSMDLKHNYLPPLSTSIRQGDLFDRNMLDTERDNVSGILRNEGYFQFNKSMLYFEADSALNNNTVNLTLKLMPETESNSPFRKYFFNDVNIYLDFDPFDWLRLNKTGNYLMTDSIQLNGYNIYYTGNKPSLRPKTLLGNCFILPGKHYSQSGEDVTYSAFASLGALSNVHIHFDEFVRNDSNLINASILAMPSRKLSFTYSIEGTNTAGNLGVATDVGVVHRNLFRGSEMFNIKIRGAYETISNFENPYLEIGGEASIHIPKVVFPYLNSLSRRMKTSTEFSLSYNQQTRPEYSRTLFSGGIHYSFQGRDRIAGRHQFDLIDIDYVYLPTKDSTFMSRLPAGAQYFGYTDQFIVGSGYSYTKTTFDPMQKQRDAYSFRFQFETAGNMLYAINKIFSAEKDDISYKVFNTYFAQFIKGDASYARTHIIDRHNSFAWRTGFGIGFPYGNSEMLPFEKRYYSGGANSVRAWTVRELGPGNYQPGDSTTFFNQSGDIKLDLNIEYRTRFFWKLEAAVFVDAGNIWTVKKYDGQYGGVFKLREFYKQIALGYGLGLRLDMNFFLVRFDCGWKIYDPARRGSDAWTVLHPNLSDNWAWHIAVGYPF
jgi:hypothetical protein